MGAEGWKATLQKRPLGVWGNTKLNTCQQRICAAEVTSGVLGCTEKNAASRLREVILSFYSALLWPHLECYLQYKRDTELLEQSPAKSH